MQHDELSFTNTPNILTSIRIALIPLVVYLLFLGEPKWDLVAALIFGAASITDFFDGYIARSQNLVTVYGKLMDPLADKFLVVCSMVMLQHLGRIHPVVVMLVISREMAITGLRALASAEGLVISASGGGKLKTVAQMFALPFMMVKQGIFGIPLYQIGEILLYLSLGLSLLSAKDYMWEFFKTLREKQKKFAAERKVAKLNKKQLKAARKALKAQAKIKS